MSEKILRQTDDLLLAGVLWDQADTRIFPALLSGLACSTLKVAAFFAPPGPNPDEACFFVPSGQTDLLFRFCRQLRQQTGAPIQVRVTAKRFWKEADGTWERSRRFFGMVPIAECCYTWERTLLSPVVTTGMPRRF